MSIEAAARMQEEALREFADLCRKGRQSSITTKELGANLGKYQEASTKYWEALFVSIADTGVKVVRSENEPR
jgi:hypothetical protein